MRRALAVLVVLALGCARDQTAPAPEAARASTIGDASVEDAAVVDAAAALPARLARCERCHEDVAAEHGRSMHAQAFDDPLFQREWSHGRPAWCVPCHAPLARDASDARAHEGVGCLACHGAGGRITSAHASGRAPHDTLAVDDAMASERCGTCHDFPFPGGGAHPERMQRTLEEWRASERPETCATCHMPSLERATRAGLDHGLRGPRDPGFTAQAVHVDVVAHRARGRVVVDATLTLDGAAHAVPTGDLYRRLVLRVEADSGARAEADMSRLFVHDPEGATREIADQRVLPGTARRLRFELDGAAREVRWALSWHALPEHARDATRIDRRLREQTWASGRARVRAR